MYQLLEERNIYFNYTGLRAMKDMGSQKVNSLTRCKRSQFRPLLFFTFLEKRDVF